MSQRTLPEECNIGLASVNDILQVWVTEECILDGFSRQLALEVKRAGLEVCWQFLVHYNSDFCSALSKGTQVGCITKTWN
jgi:hypothetical protein